jgi:hypothetical protein
MRLAAKSCAAVSILAFLTLTACNRAPVYEWHQIEGPDGTFSITLPGAAVKQDSTLQPDGLLVKHSIRVKTSENASYACVWWDDQTPAPTPEQRLDNLRDSVVAALQSKILDEKRLTVQGHPARDIRVIVGNEQAYDNRIVVVGNRIYSLMVASKKRDSKNVDKFFKSLVLH